MKQSSLWQRPVSRAPAPAPQRRVRLSPAKSHVLAGYTVAERGSFKSEGRGQFDDESLKLIASLMKATEPVGLKSRFGHPGLFSDGIGTFLGRARGACVDGARVRADLHLDPSAARSPLGDLRGYVETLAASDPKALGSSLVLMVDEYEDIDPKTKRPRLSKSGEPSPPIWRPTRLLASDIVDEGDAVSSLLSAERLSAATPRLDRVRGRLEEMTLAAVRHANRLATRPPPDSRPGWRWCPKWGGWVLRRESLSRRSVARFA